MNELNVQYHNKLNNVPLENFTALEMDVFMGICLLMKDKEDLEHEISLQELRDVISFKAHSLQRLDSILWTVKDKLKHLNYASIETDEFVGDVYLFSYFGKSKKNKDIWKIGVNKYATYILNHLTQEWTMFRLSEYTSLNSRYAKTLFRCLKQWRTVGSFKISLSDFRTGFDVPENFSTSKIDERVIKPAVDEVSVYFQNLAVEKIYGVNEKNKMVLVGYSFTFSPERKTGEMGKMLPAVE